ncbi:hypothetical protein QTV49_000342 [Vibrio vulnificus]|nr:hypothetical protein [Vibrio vulnificus]
MQVDINYITNGASQSAYTNNVKNPTEAETAAIAFSALFVEKMLNDTQSDESLFSNEEKSAGEIMSNQLLNRQLSLIISETSDLKQTFKEYLEKTQK